MQIPGDAVIAPEKLTQYLLVPRPWDDKSKYLVRAGFTLQNPAELEAAIRRLAADEPADPDGANAYGTFYRIDGSVQGPNGRSLPVTLIWLQWAIDGSFHLVTLKPRRVKS